MSRPAQSEQKCIDAIRAAGTIRSAELSAATGISTNNLTTALAKAISRGAVVACKVSGPNGGRSTNEYRIGGGMAAPEFTPLNTRRAGIACSTPAARHVPSAEAAKGTLAPRDKVAETPVFLRTTTPQPAVGNTGSAQSDPISPDERAVTSDPETPGPQPKRRGMGPASAKAPAGDVLELPRLSIDQDGSLQIGDTEDPARWVFTPGQTLAIGDFLHATQGVWRP